MDCKVCCILLLLSAWIGLASPMDGNILNANHHLDDSVVQHVYLKHGNNDTFTDETILLRTKRNNAFVSYDGGLAFNKIELRDNGRILDIIVNKYFPDYVYLTTINGYIYVSCNRAVSFKRVKAPSKRSIDFALLANPLSFHKYDPHRFIYAGVKGCHFWNSVADCKTVSFVTKDNGETFTSLLENTRFCFFAGKTIDSDSNLVFCEQYYANGDIPPNPRMLISSDYFKTDQRELLTHVLRPTETANAIVVPAIVDDNSLSALISFDGSTLAKMAFPPNLGFDRSWEGASCEVIEMDGSEHPSMFFHLKRSIRQKYLYFFCGALFKGNIDDGTYTLVADYVNGNRKGVDFEGVYGLEGTAIINTVNNYEAIESEFVDARSTKIKTKITYDEGSKWNYLTPPALGSERDGPTRGEHEQSLESYSLNLKGPTERRFSKVKSSCNSAAGFIFGVGNVGKYLDRDPDSFALYFSKDAGISWKKVANGDYLWAFGDQGRVLVVVEINKKVDTLRYSLDEGETWLDYKFTDEKIDVYDLVSLPSDASRKFIIFENENPVPSRETNIRNVYTIGFDEGDPDFWMPKNLYGGVKYSDKHGTLLTLFGVVITGGAWYIYDRGIKRNGGFSRVKSFAGQDNERISGLIEDNNIDRVVNYIVRVSFGTYQLFEGSVPSVFKRLFYPNRDRFSQEGVAQPFLANNLDSERD
ncbi:BA75_00345T0 [Komagataella pastoris]|uniref:BA75_00345T0 n=1 Tax=Komagataella pastoris TaxID=4922 RepID=A0A1B2J798_PICPA|nr:BA75_00345T0 [Komagataella pastoris]